LKIDVEAEKLQRFRGKAAFFQFVVFCTFLVRRHHVVAAWLVSGCAPALSLALVDFIGFPYLCRHSSSRCADEEPSLPRSTNVARIMIFAPATPNLCRR
jgi:hypothetical protein